MSTQAPENKPLNPIEGLKAEEAKAQRSPERYGILAAKSGNSWVEDGLLLPDPVIHYHGMVVQFENTAIFGPTGAGKTVFAMQIAEEIARNNKLLYIDLELSAKQFSMRSADKDTGDIHVYPEGFLRAEIDPELITREDMEKAILESIEEAAKKGILYFVLDNISFACNDSEKGATAGAFMMQLVRLKKQYSLTLICVAHTPKIRGYEPLTTNDMAGSAKLMNFFDAGIAIGKSAKDSNLRYVKQVKCRSQEIRYDGENVAVYELMVSQGRLSYEFVGYSSEQEHLKQGNPADDLEEIYAILKLQTQGMSLREIADALEISLGKVQRRLKKAKDSNITLPPDDDEGVSAVSTVSEPIQPIQPIQGAAQLELPLTTEEHE